MFETETPLCGTQPYTTKISKLIMQIRIEDENKIIFLEYKKNAGWVESKHCAKPISTTTKVQTITHVLTADEKGLYFSSEFVWNTVSEKIKSFLIDK